MPKVLKQTKRRRVTDGGVLPSQRASVWGEVGDGVDVDVMAPRVLDPGWT